MGLTLDYLPVNSAVRGPALDPAESAWEGWTANRNLLHPASRYQLSFAEVGAHTVTAYGEIPSNDSVKSLLISWEATKNQHVYANRHVIVPESACEGLLNGGGNTLVIRAHRGWGHSSTGIWVIPLSAAGEFRAPENPFAIQISEKPVLRYFVNGSGDHVAIIEAQSPENRSRYDFKEFKIDYFAGSVEMVRFDRNFDTTSVSRLGYHNETNRFSILYSEDAKAEIMKVRIKNQGVVPEPDSE